ncbi:LOW QUALITY PROTEIN: hypothetical protein ACHAWX_003240 [Stephanocyclus meneghinianus]
MAMHWHMGKQTYLNHRDIQVAMQSLVQIIGATPKATHTQSFIQPQNIETSRRRECQKCKLGEVVHYCPTCKKFYHNNRQCHLFTNCNVNPYN